MNIEFRGLRDDELDAAYGIICDAVDWLLSKNIRQWTVPLPRREYEKRQRKGQNYALVCDGKLAVVLSLLRVANPDWKEQLSVDKHWWLSTAVTAQGFHGRDMGRRAIQEAINFLRRNAVEEVYLDCARGSSFLAQYYESLGFERVARKDIEYPLGTFDMVLMKKVLQSQ
jgi:RimJ/RimL family protein N-acetyltransferase